MKLISIIVPIYNVEQYLPKCIDSIINQTYTNLEIILVNDGSTDDSGKICDEYAKKDRRILVIHKSHDGVAGTRNVGIDNAKGDYICFIDSDDFVRETYVEDLMNAVLEHNADMAVCLFEEGLKKYFRLIYENKFEDVIILNNLEALEKIYDKDLDTNMIVVWNKLYSKKLFKELRFPKGKIHEDEFIVPKLLYKANKIIIINKYNYYYYHSPNSIMRSKFKLKRLDILVAFEDRILYFKKNGLSELANKTINVYTHLLINFLCVIANNNDYNEYKKVLINKLKQNFFTILKLKEVSIKIKIQTIVFCFSPRLGIFLRTRICKLLGK